ncbi:hypothetical protein MKW98_001607 [Papaver atlanticum]|uniref:Bidirectional sugar transporter SWEET n=1 Tax=Papaver atlanticum TaxID=357466 RepID=A0AAD4SAJ1_9MAGN|nr:hypothetical protein MKW98_001607 [Papaver atlanticum]
MIGFVFYFEAVVLITLLPKSWSDTAIGLLCVLVNPLLYKVPCNILARVFETKSLEYMSFPGSLHGYMNAGCWLTYGLLRDDPYIITCSTANCVLGIVQLGVYAYYYFNYPQPKSYTVDDALSKLLEIRKINDEKAAAESNDAVSKQKITSKLNDEKIAQKRTFTSTASRCGLN